MPADVAIFPAGATGHTVSIDGDYSVDSLSIDNSGGNYAFEGSGSLDMKGGTTISITGGGTTLFGVDVTLKGNTAVSVASGGTLDVQGTIDSSGGVTLGGGGTLELAPSSGENSFTSITINSGTIIVANDSALGGAADTDITVNNGGTYVWTLGALKDDATPGVAGEDFDLIRVLAGGLTIGSQLQLVLGALAPDQGDSFWAADHRWTIIEVLGGSSTNAFGNNEIVQQDWPNYGFFTTANVDGDIRLNWTVQIPEPTSILLLIGSALPLLGRRRSRRV